MESISLTTMTTMGENSLFLDKYGHGWGPNNIQPRGKCVFLITVFVLTCNNISIGNPAHILCCV